MTFTELGLDARLVARLDALGLTHPTPIQREAIPPALAGRDLVGIAQTGTGKTVAFGAPLVAALIAAGDRPAPRRARGLILAPTRELAAQIASALEGFAGPLRVALVVGGKSIGAQAQRLARGVDILIATPGRLLDLADRGAVDLKGTRFLVLDEADQMLDIGFAPALRRLAAMLGRERQTLMFSATMAKPMAALAAAYLTDAVRVEVSPPGKAADRVEQSVHFLDREEKPALLVDLLKGHAGVRALVFSRTKHGAERLTKQIARAGIAAGAVHGGRNQNQRDRAIAAFRDGSVRVLVATDVAARGLDIPEVGHVYNYDLPTVPQTYVHRIGRTARAGRAGQAVAFCTAEEMGDLRAIEKTLGAPVPVARSAPWAEAAPAPVRAGAAPKAKRPRRRGARRRPERLAA